MCVDLRATGARLLHLGQGEGTDMRILMSMCSWDAILLQSLLQEQHFLVTAAHDGEEIFAALNLMSRPVVILETDLPDQHWSECLRRLRREYRNMTILVLNTRNSLEDLTHAFALGADDVFAAGMSGPEIAARIRAIMVRRSGHASPNLSIGPLRLRMEDRRAFWGPLRIDLTPTQYRIFETICLAAPYAISKDVIMAELYGVETGCDIVSINVFVSHVRSRLVAAGAPWNTIETVQGRGYRLSAFAEASDGMAGEAAPASTPIFAA